MPLYAPWQAEHDEALNVISWRQYRLLEMGFEVEDAEALSLLPHVDLHEVEHLLNQGCSPSTCAELVR